MTDEVLSGEVIPADTAEQEKRVRRGFWRTMKRAIRYVPFSDEVVAGYYCAIDANTPARVRAALLGALAYFVLPLDAIPDFIVGTGFADDATILLGTLSLVRSHITPRHRALATEALADKDA